MLAAVALVIITIIDVSYFVVLDVRTVTRVTNYMFYIEFIQLYSSWLWFPLSSKVTSLVTVSVLTNHHHLR